MMVKTTVGNDMTDKLFSATQNEDGSITLSGGQRLIKTHNATVCLGAHCVLHNPTDHEFRSLPLFFIGQHMVREQEDGTKVIDPDDYVFNSTGNAIIRNSAKCLKCNVEIESTHRHDFKSCECDNIFVDGGNSYIRRGVKDPAAFVDTSIVFTAE